MELILLITILIAAALINISVKNRIVIEFLSVGASIVAFLGSTIIALKVSDFGIYSPSVFFSVDSLGAIVMLIIALVGLAATVYSVQYLRRETAQNIIGFTRVKQYFVLLDLFLAAMFLAVTTSNPIFAWISIEATTLSTAFLISFYNKPAAMEAAWKYLIINSIGLLLGFLGTLLYFTYVNSLPGNGFADWQLLTATAAYLNPALAKIAFIFVLIGYGTKIGLAPMHTWLPDAHSKAPIPISALLSGVLLNVAFIVMLRFKLITDASIGPDFSRQLLIVFGLLSVVVASLINFTQKNYKRLLAYHSIENMGIATLGFGFGGLGVYAAMLHIIYHALIKSALFLSSGIIFLKYGSTRIAKVRGIITTLPVTGVLFLIGFFIITGTPPFGMFFTKILVFSAGIKTYPTVTIVALFSAAILFISFFHHATTMVFGKKPPEINRGKENAWLTFPPLVLIAVVFYLSFSLPPFLYKLITNAVLQY